jgi:hypothetical protein
MPATLEGKAIARRNSLKHGLTAGSHLLTDAQEQSLPAVLAPWQERYAHLTHPDVPRLLRDLAIASIRINQCQDAESALRQHRRDPDLSRRDADFEAAELFDRLHLAPELTVRRLERSAAGCARLIRAWQSVFRRVELGLSWPPALVGHTLDLLGVHPYEIECDPDAIAFTDALRTLLSNTTSNSDPDALAAARIALLALVAHRIADLESLLARHEADAAALPPNAADADPSPQILRLRRHESANRRLYRRCLADLDALDAAQPKPEPTPEVEPEPEPKPEPRPTEPAPSSFCNSDPDRPSTPPAPQPIPAFEPLAVRPSLHASAIA